MAKSKHLFTLSSEYASYQSNNPLTKYVERVCGINSTQKDSVRKTATQKLRKRKYRAKQKFLLQNFLVFYQYPSHYYISRFVYTLYHLWKIALTDVFVRQTSRVSATLNFEFAFCVWKSIHISLFAFVIQCYEVFFQLWMTYTYYNIT